MHSSLAESGWVPGSVSPSSRLEMSIRNSSKLSGGRTLTKTKGLLSWEALGAHFGPSSWVS